MKLAFIGIGNVGYALADRLQQKGHEILIAHNNPNSDSVIRALESNPEFWLLPVQEAVEKADVVFLATSYNDVEKVLGDLRFNRKTLIDCTNPVGSGLKHALGSRISGSEMIQQIVPDAHVVKAFSIYGLENLIDSYFPKYNVLPVMMIAGNSPDAKREVRMLCDDLGFETLDTGTLDQALHLEHMALMWMKLVRMEGYDPHLVWAKLQK